MEKPNNKHGIPNDVYAGWLKEATTAYEKQGNLTGSAQFTHKGKTYVFRKKGNYANGQPRFAVTSKDAKQATQTSRDERISQSTSEMDQARRTEAAAQWDELVGDRKKTFTLGDKTFTFDEYVKFEVERSKAMTEGMKTKAAAEGKTLGHGTPTTDTANYAESYTQQFAESGESNYATQDKIPLDQTERMQQAGLRVGVTEAAKGEIGTAERVGDPKPAAEVERILKPGPEVPTYSASLLSKFSPYQRQQLEAAPTLEAKENLIKQFKTDSSGTKINALRVARNLAPAMLSIPAGIAVTGQSAAAAVKNPTQDNIVNAGFDAANTVADLVGLIPTPMTIGASEAAQRALMMGQMGYNAQRRLQRMMEAEKVASMENK